MDDKTLETLEFPKILEHIAAYASFAPTAEKAAALRPLTDLKEAQRLQAETHEAFSLLVKTPDLTIGGARDVREQVDLASHGGVLTPVDLLDIKSTLIAARTLVRRFERVGKSYPRLAELAAQMRKKLHDWRKRVGAQEMSVNPNYDPKRAEMRFAEE